MFEIIEQTPSNKFTPGGQIAETQRVIARSFTLCQVQSLLAGNVLKAIIETPESSKPKIGDQFIGYVGNTFSRVSMVVEADITDVCTLHIDLSDANPLWISGNPAGRSERETFAKALGFNTWRQFTQHYINHCGCYTLNGFVISW